MSSWKWVFCGEKNAVHIRPPQTHSIVNRLLWFVLHFTSSHLGPQCAAISCRSGGTVASELSSFLTLGLFTRSFSFLSYFTLLLFSSLNELGWVDTQMAHSFKDGSRLLVILLQRPLMQLSLNVLGTKDDLVYFQSCVASLVTLCVCFEQSLIKQISLLFFVLFFLTPSYVIIQPKSKKQRKCTKIEQLKLSDTLHKAVFNTVLYFCSTTFQWQKPFFLLHYILTNSVSAFLYINNSHAKTFSWLLQH